MPADQRDRRIIDQDNVCAAITALGSANSIEEQAQRFAVLGDPTRLRLLVAIHAAGPISVSDLAVAAGLSDDHVSQTLRFLRASHTVIAERDGRVVRYRIADPFIAQALSDIEPVPPHPRVAARGNTRRRART